METLGVKEGGFNPAKIVEKSGEEIVVNTLMIKIDKLNSGEMTSSEFKGQKIKIDMD